MATPASTKRSAAVGHHLDGRLVTLSDGTKAFVPFSDTSPAIGNSRVSDAAEDFSIVHKFGKNDAVGTSVVPLCLGGIYRMPQVANATALRVKAGNSNDTAAGSGAREITLTGLDETGAEVVETLATAGASPSANTDTTYIRLYRALVSGSGTYPANIGANSQAAAVVIENAAGSEDWLTINAIMAQSHVGAYSVPLGKTAYINSFLTTVDSNKPHDLLMFVRENILQTVVPYSGFRNMLHIIGLEDSLIPAFDVPLGPFPALADIVWASKVTANTASVSIDFEIMLKNA